MKVSSSYSTCNLCIHMYICCCICVNVFLFSISRTFRLLNKNCLIVLGKRNENEMKNEKDARVDMENLVECRVHPSI